MPTTRRYELSDAQWARLEPLLPPEKPWTGRPNDDHRRILNGIPWILNSGAPWRDLPRHYGRVGTVSSRFYRWLAYGSTCWRRCRPWPMPRGGSAGSCTSWTARSCALTSMPPGTGREPGAEDEALGRSRGGFTTKIHLRCEGYGKPVIFTVTGGQVHDTRQVSALISRGAIRRIGRGRPRLRPTKLVGDKAYSSRSIRLALRRRGITPVIPTKANERRQPDFDREAYRQRNIIERLINRLKNFRRIATRYEKRAVNYLAMITIGAILLWL